MFHNSIRFIILTSLLAFSGFTFSKPCLASSFSTDTEAVRAAVIHALSHPGMPADANPQVDDLAIVGNYAITDWSLADGGGEDVLQQVNGQWKITIVGGGVFESSELIQAGVPESIANQLIQQIQAQWPH